MKSAKIRIAAATLALLIAASPALSFANSGAKITPKAQTIAYANQAKAAAAAPVIPAGTQIQMPPPEAMIIMIRSSLVALSHANMTGNYQVLSALGSDNFRAANPPARLAELFAPFRTNNIDLAPVVFVTPQVSQQPAITGGKLRLTGFFPTQPMQVNYDLQFEPSAGTWKLYGIAVNLNTAQSSQQQSARAVNPELSR